MTRKSGEQCCSSSTYVKMVRKTQSSISQYEQLAKLEFQSGFTSLLKGKQDNKLLLLPVELRLVPRLPCHHGFFRT